MPSGLCGGVKPPFSLLGVQIENITHPSSSTRVSPHTPTWRRRRDGALLLRRHVACQCGVHHNDGLLHLLRLWRPHRVGHLWKFGMESISGGGCVSSRDRTVRLCASTGTQPADTDASARTCAFGTDACCALLLPAAPGGPETTSAMGMLRRSEVAYPGAAAGAALVVAGPPSRLPCPWKLILVFPPPKCVFSVVCRWCWIFWRSYDGQGL